VPDLGYGYAEWRCGSYSNSDVGVDFYESKQCKVNQSKTEIKQLQAERDAYRKAAIAWFNHEGPCLSNLVNQDIAADVDKFAAQDVRAAEAGKART